ncbi:MAG TPA: hypothetical protein DCL60_03095 [Armatimonadetes bacterium]|nr:hypothetical protein [Armatimonadota bacterium]
MACSTVLRSGEEVSVPAGESIADDLVASGQNLNIGGNVAGDLLAAGGQVSSTGRVGQSAMLAGGTINISGPVAGSLRAAGGQVNVSGPVGKNLMLAGGTLTVSDQARVGRDVDVAGGNVRIAGNVAGNVRISGGQVYIDGVVGQNVVVYAGKLTLGPRALIKGDLTYTSGKKASIASGAKVLGQTKYTLRAEPIKEKKAKPWMTVWLFIRLVGAFIVGLIVIALAPRDSISVADRISGSPWISMLAGFIILVVVPVAAAILAVTLIGLPLAVILLAVYFILLYLSRLFVALSLGRWIFALFRMPGTSPYLAFLVGIVVLWFLTLIPFLGGWINFIILILGLGGMIMHRYYLLRAPRAQE